MKNLLIILFLPLLAHSQAPKVMAEASSIKTNKISDTLYGSHCDFNCLPVASWIWTQMSGPKAAIAVKLTDSTMIATGLTTGSYIFQLRVTNSAGVPATDTVGFSVNLPVIPPITAVCDTAGIIAAWVKAHPCPPIIPCPPPIICPVCPPPTKQRTAIGITWDIITNKKTITYDDKSTSVL